jgi:hypothetical protein
MLNGEDTLEDMIASVDDGLYAVNFDGGQVNTPGQPGPKITGSLPAGASCASSATNA